MKTIYRVMNDVLRKTRERMIDVHLSTRCGFRRQRAECHCLGGGYQGGCRMFYEASETLKDEYTMMIGRNRAARYSGMKY